MARFLKRFPWESLFKFGHMSDNRPKIQSGEAVQSDVQRGEQHRVRKGSVRLRERRSRTEPTDGDSSERKRDVSGESTSDISNAQAERLARREQRKAKRLKRSKERQSSLPEKPELSKNATDEEKSAHAEELSVAKLRREQRRAERAKRRAERAELRAKAPDTPSSKETLSGLFNKNTPSSEKSHLDKTDTDYSENIDPNESQNNIDPPLSENSKLGTETIGTGQIAQPISHSKRISNKLEQAAQKNKKSKNKDENSAEARLRRVLDRTLTPAQRAKAEKAKEAAKEKELSTQEKFKAGLERALIEGLQKTGKEVDTFQALQVTATNSKYASAVENLQKRATTHSIRIVKETDSKKESQKSAAENVGHIFGKKHANTKPPKGQENTPPFSENIHSLMTALR